MIKNWNLCVECRACEQICPKECISFDKNGIITINEERCIDCHLCEKKCQLINPVDYKKEANYFAAVEKDNELRKISSSGGIANVLYKNVLKSGGVVFGARYSEDLIPFIDCVENESELSPYLKSKYVFSNVGSAYKKCKSFCEIGRKVLFIALPCQIAGLKLYLGKEYDNLILVDILCHGAPHYSVFYNHKIYLEKKYKNKVIDYQFRDKFRDEYGPYHYNIKLENDKIISGSALWDAYYNGFIKAKIFRQSCYDCKYARKERVSDITIGDFWKAKESIEELSDYKYISSIIISSAKGKKLLSNCKDDIMLFESNYEELAKSTHAVVSPERRAIVEDVEKLKDYNNYCKWAKKYEYSFNVIGRKIKNIFRLIK